MAILIFTEHPNLNYYSQAKKKEGLFPKNSLLFFREYFKPKKLRLF